MGTANYSRVAIERPRAISCVHFCFRVLELYHYYIYTARVKWLANEQTSHFARTPVHLLLRYGSSTAFPRHHEVYAYAGKLTSVIKWVIENELP